MSVEDVTFQLQRRFLLLPLLSPTLLSQLSSNANRIMSTHTRSSGCQSPLALVHPGLPLRQGYHQSGYAAPLETPLPPCTMSQIEGLR